MQAPLKAVMGTIAASLTEPGDVNQALSRIIHVASETVPGADYASITVRRGPELETVSATADLILEIDQIQYKLQEGPCYDAVTNGPVTYAADLTQSVPWPRYGPQAAERGLYSQMAIRLADDGQSSTGLNLYSEKRAAFADAADVAQLFASHATVALGYARQLQTLTGAIATRELIGKAIGISMERYNLSDERALEFLIRLSQTSNTKLRDVAAQIVADGNGLED